MRAHPLQFEGLFDKAFEGHAPAAAAGAWPLLLGAMALRKAGRGSQANEYLNRAVALVPQDDVCLRAELLSEAGLAMLDGDRFVDGAETLNMALPWWDDACEALLSCGPAGCLPLARRLLPLFEAAGTALPFEPAAMDAGDAQCLMRRWLFERALPRRAQVCAALARACARAGHADDGRALVDELVGWIEPRFVIDFKAASDDWPAGRSMDRGVRVALYRLQLARGEIELEAGDAAASADAFGAAAALYEEAGAGDSGLLNAQQARFNQANALLRLGRHDEALKLYQQVEWVFERWFRQDLPRVQHAIMLARERRDRVVLDPAALRHVIAQGETALRGPQPPTEGKAVLVPQYRMLLNTIARQTPLTAASADEWLRVVRALREDGDVAGVRSNRDDAAPADLFDGALAPIDALLRRLPDHVLLALEPGADTLSWFALRGGSAPLAERATLALASADGVRAIEALIACHRADVERLADGAAVDADFDTALRDAGRAAWQGLPPAVATLIGGARTLLVWASPHGNLGELPIELLLHGGAGRWLGISHVVARFASWRTLLETLSPQRTPSVLAARARVVCAGAPERGGVLPAAESEVQAVEAALTARGLTVAVDRAPAVATMRDALNAGDALLHFIGHGRAGTLGETLPLGGGEHLRPEDLSSLDGWRSPCVVLSTCELARSRAGQRGGVLGFAPRMIEKGMPAVVGCVQTVDDAVALEMARALHEAPPALPLGRALARARQRLEASGVPAACWGAYALFGDPNLRLPAPGQTLQQTRHLTRDWPAWVSRWACLRSRSSRRSALAALSAAHRAGDALDDVQRQAVAQWITASFDSASLAVRSERAALGEQIGHIDALAGAALRFLLCIESIEGCYAAAPQGTTCLALIDRAMLAARATHDLLAWSALALRRVEATNLFGSLDTPRLLDEAELALAGWTVEEPRAKALLKTARALRRAR